MTSRQAKLQEDTYFRVMRILQDNPDLTQRELAEKLGISVNWPRNWASAWVG
jgi:DNA-binding Lrp family transcriptional regulator